MPSLKYDAVASEPTNTTSKVNATTVCRPQFSESFVKEQQCFEVESFEDDASGPFPDYDPGRSSSPRKYPQSKKSPKRLSLSNADLCVRNKRELSGAHVSCVPSDPEHSKWRSRRVALLDKIITELGFEYPFTSVHETGRVAHSRNGLFSTNDDLGHVYHTSRDFQSDGVCEPSSGETTPISSSPSLSGATLASTPTNSKNDFESATLIVNVSPSSTVYLSSVVSPRQKMKLRSTQFFGVYPRIPSVYVSPLDRFLPLRTPPEICRERLLTSIPASALSNKEMTTRRTSATSNPFLPRSRRPRSNAMPNLYQNRLTTNRPSTILALRAETTEDPNRAVAVEAFRRTGGRTLVSTPDRSLDSEVRRSTITTNIPVYRSRYLRGSTDEDELETYERRIALALGLDQATSVLTHTRSRASLPTKRYTSPLCQFESEVRWRNNEWAPDKTDYLLEAPNLRNDYYCSVLAHSNTAQVLAVGLSDKLYLWNEIRGVSSAPPQVDQSCPRSAYITSLSFSSESGGCAILALGRSDGQVVLFSPIDEELRLLNLTLSTAAACVSFRPAPYSRISQRHSAFRANNEVLVIGEDSGALTLYFVEWPTENERYLFGWNGGVMLFARVQVHTQQICGIAWSSDGNMFATGGNDNLCCLFEVSRTLRKSKLEETSTQLLQESESESLSPKHQWHLTAAVKAMAFCGWQKGLMAVGGGSNDRCIHFFHTLSSARLATIDCAAQVTSLMWSKTKREVAATFGFAQPEHPYRIAVYSWPECQQVLAIPWQDDMRALYAIPYPGGPRNAKLSARGHRESNVGDRTEKEGCIVVAASDGSIKFHEVWYGSKGSIGTKRGMFGGSAILESLHGIEKDLAETIR